MNDIRFDPTGAQPARQPEAVAAGLEGNDNARDGAAGLDGFVTPAMQQLEQGFLVRCELLQWIARDTGNDSANQPSCPD